MTAYSTTETAIAAGADGTDLPALTALLEQVAARIDMYTGTWFDLRVTTLRLEVDPEQSVVMLPAEGTVTAVRVLPAGTLLGATSWRQVKTRLYLPGAGLPTADILVAGAEPYRGGYRNLLGLLPSEIEVDGTFGPPTVPGPVALASDLLAAMLLPKAYTPAADAEGVPTGIPSAGDDDATPEEEVRAAAGRTEVTTGLAEADRLLTPWRQRFAGAYRMV